MKRKLFSSMTALMALFATSCTSELVLDGYPDNGTGSEEWVDMSFAISPENAQAVTRAGNDGVDDAETDGDNTQKPKGPGYKQTVGRGSKIDMLIYAVYEKDSVEIKDEQGATIRKDVSYTLLTQYGKGLIPATLTTAIPEDFDKTAGNGQTIFYDPFDINNKSESVEANSGSYEFTLRLMRGKEYTIAFWAQSSKTDAYDTSNLEEVKVSYADAANNDELRDAFCKSENFTLGADGSSREVILTRPFAQINVATTGADYKYITNTKYVNPARWVAYSEIGLKGVAQYMNVVTDEIDGKKENLTDVYFKRKAIPAFINFDAVPNIKETQSTTVNGEEYLYVKLNPKEENQEYLIYTEEYPTIDENGKYLTETFKYLSMCYVLVPATSTVTEKPNYDASDADSNNADAIVDPYNSSTLTEIVVKFAEEPTGDEAFPAVRLENVPVHRNWRTNILGGLYEKNVPDENPDDPTSVFKLPVIWVERNTDFDGDYNTYPDINDGDWTQNENPNQSDEGEAGD